MLSPEPKEEHFAVECSSPSSQAGDREEVREEVPAEEAGLDVEDARSVHGRSILRPFCV